MTINRRSFIQTAAAVTASLSAPMVMASGKPRVVVVGGGAGGATVARYIAKDSKGAIDVTLVEPSRTYYTCFFSNLYCCMKNWTYSSPSNLSENMGTYCDLFVCRRLYHDRTENHAAASSKVMLRLAYLNSCLGVLEITRPYYKHTKGPTI